MDFWSRLIGGVTSAPSKKSASNNPQQRLSRFKKTYTQALQAWHRSPASRPIPRPDPAAEDIIRSHFERLTSLLHDDTRAPIPHLCLAFAASSQIYTTITQVASALKNEAVIRETISLFSILVDSDEEGLLGNERFSRNLMSFVDSLLSSNIVAIQPETEGEVLELIFGIAAKIRLEPELLPVWFRPKQTRPSLALRLNNSTHNEFPLCYQFIGHVYLEGRVGDFARTGLLYIFESASNSAPLEEWIVASDLPTLLASGLGALYSQLSRKLTIAYPKKDLPLILALSDHEELRSPANVESFYSPDLQAQLTTFMSYLVFWQDVLEHCRSLEIKKTLIDHFRIFFLQQILYPSLLESSDIDGGSSVAVLTYLWRLLDSIDHPDLIHLMLHYLLALPEPLAGQKDDSDSPLAERRRESLFEHSRELNSDDKLNPSFFNLVDLSLASVQSDNVETVSAAMRLVTVLLRKHHTHCASALIKTVPVRHKTTAKSIGALNAVIDSLLCLAQDIGGGELMNEAYESCLKDALGLIESHVCSMQRPDVVGPILGHEMRNKGSILRNDRRKVDSHFISVDDPLLQAIMGLLKTFFTNSVEINLGLTEVLAHLVSCPFSCLDGFVSTNDSVKSDSSIDVSANQGDFAEVDTNQIEPIDMESLEKERIAAFKKARTKTTDIDYSSTPIMTIFKELAEQLQSVKTKIPELSSYLASRKRAFVGADEIENEFKLQSTFVYSPRPSGELSRDLSRSRGLSFSDSPAKRSFQQDTPKLPRGRSLAAITSQSSNRDLSPRTPVKVPPPILSRPSPSQSRRSSRELSHSPTKASRALSPLKASFAPSGNTSLAGSSKASINGELYERKIRFTPETIAPVEGPLEPSEEDSDQTNGGKGDQDGENTDERWVKEVSLNHVLTNTVILQEFIMEMAAILQVRASILDGEVRFL